MKDLLIPFREFNYYNSKNKAQLQLRTFFLSFVEKVMNEWKLTKAEQIQLNFIIWFMAAGTTKKKPEKIY